MTLRPTNHFRSLKNQFRPQHQNPKSLRSPRNSSKNHNPRSSKKRSPRRRWNLQSRLLRNRRRSLRSLSSRLFPNRRNSFQNRSSRRYRNRRRNRAEAEKRKPNPSRRKKRLRSAAAKVEKWTPRRNPHRSNRKLRRANQSPKCPTASSIPFRLSR